MSRNSNECILCHDPPCRQLQEKASSELESFHNQRRITHGHAHYCLLSGDLGGCFLDIGGNTLSGRA